MDPKAYLELFFSTRKNPVNDSNRILFDDFCNQSKYLDAATQILSIQEMIMKDWQIKNRINEIINQHVLIPNGSVGKAYNAILDFAQLGWEDIIAFELDGLDQSGLHFDMESKAISGTPVTSGDIKLTFRFQMNEDTEAGQWNEKRISLIINPDPKSLWKDLPSDESAPFWKPDNASENSPLGERHIVVASKRGRSHANVGSFRDDDFAFKYFAEPGWSVVAVSDGAGSARYSREGARAACQEIIEYFDAQFKADKFSVLDSLLPVLDHDADQDISQEISRFIYRELGYAAKHVHNLLEQKAKESDAAISDFHATLIFVLVKKYDFGYAILSFGVGDCPIAILEEKGAKVTMMNTLDVGEFGGGTRFITMPEIFHDENFSKRFGFKLVKDFEYIMMMSDGIYDPKFEVEANLVKAEKWQQFLSDLNGANNDAKAVVLDSNNRELATQLSDWMDFWSPGNHDDRTLAIVF